MKKNIKRLALLITVVMLVQAIFVGVFTVNASAALSGNFTGYTKASDVNYVYDGDYIANWGARGEVATFLTTNALEFSSGSYAFETVSKLGGGATESAVPGSDLYKKLQDLMKSKHTYQTSYNATRDLFQYTDCVNGNAAGGISSFYSGEKIGPAWGSSPSWNREHTWPNSKGDLAGNGENDLMMLRPTSSSENSSRGNKAYGQSGGYYNPNSESGGLYDLRGDVARLSLYTYVRWGCINTGLNPNGIFGTNGIFESLDVLLSWIKADPVDTWELGRNDSVESITGTRNVFVDYPEYAFLLFGKEVPTDMVTPSSAASLGVQGGTPSTGGGTGTTPSTPTLNAVKPVVGTAYKLGMNQTYAGKIVYMLGTESGYYLATTETMTSGLDFYIEETSGGYYIYTSISGAKKYLDMVPTADGAHVNAKYVSTPTVVYTWNDTLKTFVGNVNSADYVFGTRNDNSYVTVGCNKVSYDPFVVQFVPADGSSNPGGNPGGSTGGGTGSDTPSTGAETTVKFVFLTYAQAQGMTIGSTSATQCKTWPIDSNITMTVAGGQHSGKIYTDGVRIYATDSPAGSITFTAPAGMTIKSIKFSIATGTYADLQYNGSAVTNGQVVSINASSATFNSVKVGSEGKQVRIANVEVVYTGGSGGTTPDTPDTPDTPVTPPTPPTPSVSLTPVKPVVGTAYKLGMAQTKAGKVVYMIGEYQATYYIGTTETKASGLDFYIEETTGGYYIYTTIGGAKQYLNMVPSGTHVNAKYENAPSTVYTWNETAKTFTSVVNDAEYAFGTRNDNTYTTVGCYQLSGSPFTVQFVATEGGTTPDNPGTTPDNPDNPDNPTPPAGNTNGLADAVKPVVGSDYKLAMNQTLAGKVVYLLGSESGYYLATTVNKDHGLIFNIEETTGGYYIYTMINGAKKYLDMVPSADGAHVNAKYVDAPTVVYTWNEAYKTFVGNVGGDEYVFGTRNDKNYETVGCNKLSYEPFVLQFIAVEGNNQGGNDQGGNDQGGNTPGGNTPGGNTPGGNTPGGNDNTQTGEPAPSDTKSGCGSAIGGISAVIIALVIPFMFFKKKDEDEE